MLARHNHAEALRMAGGLVLLDDVVTVHVTGALDRNAPAVAEQLDVLEFAEIPVAELDIDTAAGLQRIAAAILEADVVFVV